MIAAYCIALYVLFIAFVSCVMGPGWRRVNQTPTRRQRREWRRERLDLNPAFRGRR